MKGIICDLCNEPASKSVEIGLVIKADYCLECEAEVRALYDEIEKLQGSIQNDYKKGLRKAVEKFNKKHPDGMVPDFSWVK